MTCFETQVLLGTPVSPLVSKDKGSMGNRVECAAAQTGNIAKGLAADTVVIGGAALAGKQAIKRGKFAAFLAKPVDALQKVFAKLGKEIKVDNAKKLNVNKKFGFKFKQSKNYPERIANFLKKMPTKYKALAVIAAVAIPLVSYIGQRTTYKAGQIDQKYTDKAKVNSKKNLL